MGKKKFINKQNAATLKMVYQPGNSASEKICFQKIEEPGKNDSQQQQELSELVEKELNKGKFTNLKPRMPEINHAKEAADLVAGRDDLWINQLRKQKAQQQQQQVDVVMKHYDENGLPLDGYDYTQHIAAEQPEGEVQCVFEVPEEERERIIYDIDFKREELTEEQREVYDLLMKEDDDEENQQEELEDDFVSKIIQESKEAANQEQKKEESPKKQVRFQGESDDDGYEDVEEEEMEITYEKQPQPKQTQPKQQQSQQQQKKKDNSDSESDLEIDSDMEKEFEREMKNYDNPDDDEEEGQDPQANDQMLNQVIDDHLKTMGQKKRNKQPRIKNTEETEEKKQQRLEYLKHTDYNEYLKQKFPNSDFAQFHLKKEVPPLNPEEDIALQNYLNKDSTDEECPDMELAEKYHETIITKSLHNTTMSKMNPEQLNIIKYKSKTPQITKEEFLKEKKEQKEKLKTLKAEKEKVKEDLCNTLKQVVIKTDETPEEKKKRKELVKQLKHAQKDKKKAFKEQLHAVSKNLQKQKLANMQSNHSEGVSVVKIA